MYNFSLEEDTRLKRFTTTPVEEKPNYNWHETIIDQSLCLPNVKIEKEGKERAFDVKEIAKVIGNALTDLLLSRQETEKIFTTQNQSFVNAVVKSVLEGLNRRIQKENIKKLTQDEIDLLIEKVLIENDAHDVARSLLFKRSAQVKENNVPQNGTNTEHSLMNLRLIRRNGQVVRWNENKIEIAVRKAFLVLQADSEPAVAISCAVTKRVQKLGHAFIHIEDVQDMVQEELMRQGHYKIAENYILYRSHRAQQRENAQKSQVNSLEQESMVVIKNPDGSSVLWNGFDLKKRIQFGLIGLDLNLDSEMIERELRRSIFTEINASDLKTTIILNAKALIEKDADFSLFSGRILLSYIYEEVLGWDIVKDGIEQLKRFHQKQFSRYLKNGVQLGRIAPKLLDYDLDHLADSLDPSADLDFDYLGIQTLYDRYLIVDKTQKQPRRIETPQFFWMRVAMGIFHEEEKDREEWTARLYNLYKSRLFCSSTPTLFNSGTLHSQLSSCYLYKVDDTIESIMQRGIADNAYLSKWAGGLGGSWTAVRGTGGHIQGTNGESQGVIPFLKLHNDQLVAVNQGGKRRGSGCAYLETWHNDIIDFLELRKNTGDERRRTHDMNTANWLPDLFMKRMEARQSWTLFRSNEVADLHECYGKEFEQRYLHYEKSAEKGEIFGRKIPAIDLWKGMLKMLFETGHPWITFKDPCNIRSPQDHTGVIHSSNLCTEITLNTNAEETAVCNLGSVVLDTHLKSDGSLDHKQLEETITVAVRALDNVIDINFYPTKAALTSNKRHRPIGLGVMGLQNALYQRRQKFNSQDAIEFNDTFMETIAYYAYQSSSNLAAERGAYSSYEGSKWQRGILPPDTIDLLEQERGEKIEVPREGQLDWDALREKIKRQGMRNSNVLAIAPTATISNIMGTSPCIEPAYKNIFVKSNLSGEFIVINSFLVKDLKKRGLWNSQTLEQLKYFDGELADIKEIPDDLKELYSTAFGIDYNYIIEAASRRQKWIDQSQSLNLFLAHPDLKMLSHMYRAAWKKGLKTTYYLRTFGASNIEKATIGVKKEKKGIFVETEEKKGSQEKLIEQKKACEIEAMRNGEICEYCQ